MNAYEILLTLNDLEEVDFSSLEFCVITGRYGEPDQSWAFEVGEILVIDKEYGREILGAGRKPSKWAVNTEEFSSFAEAVKRRNEVLEAETSAMECGSHDSFVTRALGER